MTTDPGAWIAQEQAIAAAAKSDRAACGVCMGHSPSSDGHAKGCAVAFLARALDNYPLALDALAAVLALHRPSRGGHECTCGEPIPCDHVRAITDRIGGGQ